MFNVVKVYYNVVYPKPMVSKSKRLRIASKIVVRVVIVERVVSYR